MYVTCDANCRKDSLIIQSSPWWLLMWLLWNHLNVSRRLLLSGWLHESDARPMPPRIFLPRRRRPATLPAGHMERPAWDFQRFQLLPLSRYSPQPFYLRESSRTPANFAELREPSRKLERASKRVACLFVWSSTVWSVPLFLSAGYYCPRSGQTNFTDKCQAGYYCLQGQNGTSDNSCPASQVCPEGSPIYMQCKAGTYTNETGGSLEKELANADKCLSSHDWVKVSFRFEYQTVNRGLSVRMKLLCFYEDSYGLRIDDWIAILTSSGLRQPFLAFPRSQTHHFKAMVSVARGTARRLESVAKIYSRWVPCPEVLQWKQMQCMLSVPDCNVKQYRSSAMVCSSFSYNRILMKKLVASNVQYFWTQANYGSQWFPSRSH